MIKQSLVEILLNYGKKEKTIMNSFFPKDHLCPDIFKENKLNDDAREKLLSISNKFIDFLGVDFFFHDIILTGSMASYGWSQFSDIDVHIIIDFKETGHNPVLLKEFFDTKKDMWNNKNSFKINDYDVELYVQDINEEHVSSGVYSILNNMWVVKPMRESIKIDEKKILNKSHELMKLIDNLHQKYENNENISELINRVYQKIKKFRKNGLKEDGEYSYENLTFKFLRRNGYMKKLIELKNKVLNK